MPDFLPRRLADFLNWSHNFDQKLNSAPLDYGISVAQAAQYSAAHAAFAAAFQTAIEPSTRTAVTLAAQAAAEAAVKSLARTMANIVRAHPNVTDKQKVELGLRVRKKTLSRINRPEGAPTLRVVSVVGRTVKLRLTESSSGRRGKAEGIAGAVIFSFAGAEPPADRAQWRFAASSSRTICDITLEPQVAAGTQVWLTACWTNPRGQTGPLCEPIFTHLQFAVAVAA